MVSMKERIKAQIEEKFALAVIETSPFPHLIIEKLFPDDVYKMILEFNPFKANRGVEWLPKASSANVTSATPYHARKQINFHMDDPFGAPAEQRAFWDELKAIFLETDWFQMLVAEKYASYFEIRFGDLMKDEDWPSLFRRELFLQRHEPGYYIGPHTDIATRVFTCIFSFAEKEGYEEYGTELLTHEDRLVRCWGNDHYTPQGFSVAKIAPYKPNNFLLFFKTRQSFHSVKAITEDVPNQRYGMQFQFYEPRGGLFRDLSTPTLMEIKQKMDGRYNPVKRIARKLRTMAAGR